MCDTVVSQPSQIAMMIMEAARVKEKAKVVVEKAKVVVEKAKVAVGRAAAERYVDVVVCMYVVPLLFSAYVCGIIISYLFFTHFSSQGYNSKGSKGSKSAKGGYGKGGGKGGGAKGAKGGYGGKGGGGKGKGRRGGGRRRKPQHRAAATDPAPISSETP